MNAARATLPRLLLPAVVFAVALVTFLPGLNGQFLNWDDDLNLVTNPNFRGLAWSNLRWMLTTTLTGHWIPLTWLTLGVNYTLGGMDPRGYHLGNMLLHAANAALVYFLARGLLRRAGAAADGAALSAGAVWASLLFAVHPLRVESVVWITERKDVLCGLLFLSAVLAYLRAVEGPTLDHRWQVVSLAAFAASLLAKAAAMPLPALLLLLDVYPLGRTRAFGWRRVLFEKIPWAVLGLAGALTALAAVYSKTAVTDYQRYGPGARLAMTAYTFVFYPARWFWPVQLIPLYELPTDVHLLAPRFLLPTVAFVAVTAGLVALRRAWPGGLAAWTASVVMLLPISGAVHSGHQLAHDRYSYLSGLGLALLAGGSLAWLLDARARGRVSALIARSATVGAMLVILVLAAGAWDQSKIWQDSETLWRWTTEIDPACAICWNNLGTSLTDQKRHAEAEVAYRRALQLRPNRPTVINNVATALYGQQKYAQAGEMLQLALRLDPGLSGALLNMGALKAQEGQYTEALRYFRKAYAGDPKLPDLARMYALALVHHAEEQRRAGRTLEAMMLLQEALAVMPGDVEARRQLDALKARRGAPASDTR